MSRYKVSIDIGGTFTDLVVHDEVGGRAFTGKVLSTPHNPAEGVITGLTTVLDDPREIGFLVHGTTVGLNAFLERRGARVLLITTEGFKDVYTIARGDRKELRALRYRKPTPLVPPSDIHTVRERIRWDGTVQEPLHTEDLEPIIEKIQAEGIRAVAICFLHSYVNPEHELAVREILTQRLPGVSVSLSHEIAREWREYERTSTVVLNAYIAPPIENYLESLERQIAERGVQSRLYVMQSNGGVMTSAAARQTPIQTLLSGPVGGTIGGKALSEALGRPNLLCVDMGGTSFDVSLIVNGELSVSTETVLEGLPVLMSIVDIHTIGAGGGSVAWLEAGALRVGPRSAGADPGPACYGKGGTEPTVTDANLFLGRINPGYFLGGNMTLDYDASARAIGRLADSLGMTSEALAEGILAIVNAKMADAMRTLTVKRGIDPRDFSVLAFGGAGPMHAAALADELEISEVIVPWAPGTFSAWGMLHTDVRHDLVRTFYSALDSTSPEQIDDVFTELEAQGRAILEEEHVPEDRMRFIYSADMRYVGQEYFVNIPVERGNGFSQADIARMTELFHSTYRTRYGHATPGAPLEIVNLRVAALGLLAGRVQGFQPQEETELVRETRKVIFDGEPVDTLILRRDVLPIGATFEGPAVVEEQTATTVVPPNWAGHVDHLGNLILRRKRPAER
ncbi:hydantoinase/oxoprolinase family protein [Sphaerobacter thermophilus]|uniref:5-oxoprolinase (ATP-hydrolyzing) n=1 Tax=Sphaerobacter thermophilus (strain ATCC 49802 / DSM 20745 / KCCM 41009 / NCIMB 13125 / S 6022) TaxID=479434 RepID=D1CAQ6_SPHTD|nr:hydantoinase/oxoprolinase family protein [Sphaerobacter thermophilus]ACZ40899.1 5-oxoprolinase (ATP-hydrolyzing) [Sphaerobacter thermophilus DSM 20745]